MALRIRITQGKEKHQMGKNPRKIWGKYHNAYILNEMKINENTKLYCIENVLFVEILKELYFYLKLYFT